ncbi:hypothetical protein [Klenkia marina]|uniref:hypothetical protein n=1 Tax=Klenkia marina TaxID=1960309 RepID=UPI00140361D4|nr:hypothetical protein [Klenkia marina]
MSGSEIGLGMLVATAAARAAGRPISVLVQSEPERAISLYVRVGHAEPPAPR